MKVKCVKIKNFKRFGDPGIDLSFQTEGETHNRILLLGSNGAGKTTILQAIAVVWHTAMKSEQRSSTFPWSGWDPESLKERSHELVVTVELDPVEIASTQMMAKLWSKYVRHYETPGDEHTISLCFYGGNEHVTIPLGEAAHNQLRGRCHAVELAYTDQHACDLIPHLPGIFWYEQNRRSVADLDRTLISWFNDRHQYKKYDELERLYQTLFPGHSFVSPTKFGLSTLSGRPKFKFSDGNHTYGFGEMSAGEQAIFPILFDVVRHQINGSVILIDGFDANLQPPLAQRFLRSLSHIGNGNQFIITGQSRSISSIVSEDEIRRIGDSSSL